ncbi:MAG: hypothetical protein WCO60_12840 [Verrucomicrobiota bacterium]
MSKDELSDHDKEVHEHELHEEAADYHRMAAHHFELAAKHHLAAAEADEENDLTGAAAHAYIAYGHQLRAVGYAEIAAEDDVLTDIEIVENDEEEDTKS